MKRGEESNKRTTEGEKDTGVMRRYGVFNARRQREARRGTRKHIAYPEPDIAVIVRVPLVRDEPSDDAAQDVEQALLARAFWQRFLEISDVLDTSAHGARPAGIGEQPLVGAVERGGRR